MFEIEAKAHVEDRGAVIQKLNQGASYLGSVHKKDSYYKNAEGIKPRIRREIPWDTKETNLPNPAKSQILLTYKRKEVRKNQDGKVLEVNDEKESTLSDDQALDSLLKDSGFSIYLEKEKFVMGWQKGRAHIELCTVPPLGDFLEIEIMAPSNEEGLVEDCRKEIISILAQAGIGEDKIENRYYSDMLREAEKNSKR